MEYCSSDSSPVPKEALDEEPCAVCGNPLHPSKLAWQQGEGWLCLHCQLENDACGCEDPEEGF